MSAQICSTSGPSGCARQLRQAFDGDLAHRRLILPEVLNGVPGHSEGTRVLDVNIGLQDLTVLDQVEPLDHMELLGVRRPESVDPCPVVEPDRIDDQRIAIVPADGIRRTRRS